VGREDTKKKASGVVLTVGRSQRLRRGHSPCTGWRNWQTHYLRWYAGKGMEVQFLPGHWLGEQAEGERASLSLLWSLTWSGVSNESG